MRTFVCPRCGADISDSYQEAEPDVGIMGAGWFCDACNEGYGDEDGPEPHDDDVGLFGTCGGKVETSQADRCSKHPNLVPEMGYGLAGGGIGVYSYCPACGAVLHKTQGQS